MRDLKLDTEFNEVAIENYDLSLVSDLEFIRQSVSIRLQFFFSEWFLDRTVGIKLYDFFFVKNPNLNTIASIVKTFILETDGVQDMLEYSQEFNSTLRSFEITFKVSTDFGELNSSQSIGV